MANDPLPISLFGSGFLRNMDFSTTDYQDNAEFSKPIRLTPARVVWLWLLINTRLQPGGWVRRVIQPLQRFFLRP